MHHWTAETCMNFTPVGEFCRSQAPLVAFKYRYALDAMMALAALHLSRQLPS